MGAEIGRLFLTRNLNAANHVVPENADLPEHEKIEIPVTTLNSQLEKLKPTLIKIDVEGYEYDVLKGASDILAMQSLKAVLLENVNLHSRYHKESEQHRLMLEHGFRTYEYLPEKHKLTDLATKQNLQNGNTIYIRNLEEAQERLSTARKFRIRDHYI